MSRKKGQSSEMACSSMEELAECVRQNNTTAAKKAAAASQKAGVSPSCISAIQKCLSSPNGLARIACVSKTAHKNGACHGVCKVIEG